RRMSHLGLASRVTPVHTAMRNCTRDEGGPFEDGSQVLVSSHCKLLSSKAMVVSVAENPGHDLGSMVERGERKQTVGERLVHGDPIASREVVPSAKSQRSFDKDAAGCAKTVRQEPVAWECSLSP